MYAYRVNWVRVGFKTFAILGLIVIAIVNYAPLKIDLKPEAWAAWVQAIGSILAILTAVLIPALQHATTKRDADTSEFRRARALALSSLPVVHAYGDLLENLATYCSKFQDKRHIDWLQVTSDLSFGKNARRILPRLHKFGEASDSMITLYSSIHAIRLAAVHIRSTKVAARDEETMNRFVAALNRCIEDQKYAYFALTLLVGQDYTPTAWELRE